MVTGVACGLQNRYGAFARPGWVRFPHVPASLRLARLTALASVLLAAPVAAQDPPENPPPPAEEVEQGQGAPADSVPPISPLGAFGRSMLLPGWGQVEVGRPERGAIYFGAAATTMFMVIKSSQKLSAAKAADPPDEDLIASRTGQRENWIVLTLFVAFLSGIDAWVSTQFWDFETTITAPPDGSVGASFGLQVNLP